MTQFHKQIGLPASWFQSSIGLVLQSLNLYELALQAWLNEANVQQAHNIWYEKIMPLYMTKSSGIDLARALMFDSELEQAERAELIKRQDLCQRDPKVDNIVRHFASKPTQIKDWATKTGNFKMFMDMIEDLKKTGSLTGEACRSYTNTIRQIQSFSRDDEHKDPVDHFLSQQIATIGNLLQAKEDEANVKEGRECNIGVTHFAGGQGFRF